MDTATRTDIEATLASLKFMEKTSDDFTFGDFVNEAIFTATSLEGFIPVLEDGELKDDLLQSAEYLRLMAAESDRFSLGDFYRNLMEAATLISRLAQL